MARRELDLLRGFRSTFDQAAPQFLQIGRHDENIGQAPARMNGSPQLRMAAAPCVSISIKTSTSVFQIGQRSVCAMCRNDAPCTFACSRNSPARDSRAEICLGKELIILALNFAGTRRTRRAGNRINKVGRLANRFTQCRLARARWSGDNKKNSATR